MPGAADVTSVITAQRMDDDDGFLEVGDLVPTSGPDALLTGAQLSDIRDYLETSPLYRNATMITRDGRYASVIVELDDGIDAAGFAGQVEAVVSAGWDGPHALAGQAFTSHELQGIIGRDLPVLGATAMVIILLMLFLNFRTVHGTVLPFVHRTDS